MSEPDGRNKHIFVCYAHEDIAALEETCAWFKARGHAVWYDERIHAGFEWADELAEAIDECSVLLFLATPHAIESRYCRNEIAYAIDVGKPVLTVFMEPLELSGGLKLSLLRQQAIVRWQLNADEYHEQLSFALEALSNDMALTGLGTTSAKRIFQVPRARNRAFSGRESELAAINDAFGDAPGAVVLVGHPGVGKSQIALEFLYRHCASAALVAWIRAEDQASLDADFTQLAVNLGLTEARNADTPQIIASVTKWLSDHSRWWLVLDNVESPEQIATYLPAELRGNLLLTSRNQTWDRFAASVPITPFAEHEAVQFVLDRTGQDDEEAARELAQTLGFLPLALEEASAYVTATGRTLARYLDLFSEHHDELMGRSRPPADYPASLRTTLEMALGKVEEIEPESVGFLDALSYLAPDDIPLSFLAKLRVSGREPTELELDGYVSALRKYSLIGVQPDSISVHRLTQLVLRDRMDSSRGNELMEEVLAILGAEFPRVTDITGEAMPKCRRLLPHVIAALGHAPGFTTDAGIHAALLSRTGTFLSARNEPFAAARLLAEAHARVTGNAAETHRFAGVCELYGRTLYANGELVQAREVFNEALAIFAEEGEQGQRHVMQIHVDLAWVDWTAGTIGDAMDHAKTVLTMVESSGGPEDARRMAGTSILSRLHLENGDLTAARDMLAQSTAAIESLQGLRSPLLCAVFLQVGYVLRHLGAPLRAISWARESLTLGTPVFSKHHSVMGASHCVAGQAFLDLGELEEARREFEAAAECASHVAHPINQDVVTAICYLAMTLVREGRLQEAEHLMQTRLSDPASLVAGESKLALATTELAHAEIAAASDALERAVAHADNADAILAPYGSNHPYRLMPLLTRGAALAAQGSIADAEHAHEEALHICTQHEILEHPLLGRHLIGLANLYETTNDARARDTRAQALTMLERTLGPSSPAVIELQNQ